MSILQRAEVTTTWECRVDPGIPWGSHLNWPQGADSLHLEAGNFHQPHKPDVTACYQANSLILQVGLLIAYMLDTGRQKELALAAVWITFMLAGVTDSIAILAAGRHSKVPLRILVIFMCLSAPSTTLDSILSAHSYLWPTSHVHAVSFLALELLIGVSPLTLPRIVQVDDRAGTSDIQHTNTVPCAGLLPPSVVFRAA